MKYWNSLLLCALLLLTGCLSDGDIVPDDSNKVVLELTLCSSANPTGTTRALTADQEENISDMKILAFDENGKLLAVHDNIGTLNYDNQTDISKVTIKMKPEAWLGKNVTFMLLGNMSDNATLPTMTVGTTTREDVVNAITYSVDSNWPYDNTRHFPMYGTINTTLNQKQISGTVWMVRALGRLQFYVNYNATTDDGDGLYNETSGNNDLLELKSVNLYYTRTEGYFCPDLDYTNSNTDNYAIHTNDETPGKFGRRAIGFPLTYTMASTENHAYEKSIYTPENVNNSSLGSQEVVMVVGASYKGGTTTYYKVEFQDALGAHDILRNWSYNFNIKGVNGPGKPTPEEALMDGVLLNIEIIAWNEIEAAKASIKSQYELEVDNSLLSPDSRAHNGDKAIIINVGTTYAGGWFYDTDSKPSGDTWYTVTPINQGTTSGQLKIEVNSNEMNASRYSHFTIHAGNIVKQINITQLQEKTSNCYIASEYGVENVHGFNATVMGNGTYGTEFTIVGNKGATSTVNIAQPLNTAASTVYNTDGTINPEAIASAGVIWQTRPGLITAVGKQVDDSPFDGIAEGELLTSEGILRYLVGEPLGPDDLGGNALIGIFDASGNVIWSWHIWVMYGYGNAEDHDQHFLTNGVRSGYYMMDRNLGAMRNEVGDALSYGLLYQWGRKDPMRSTYDINTPYTFMTTYRFSGQDTDDTKSEYQHVNGTDQWQTWSEGTTFTDILTSVRNPMNISTKWGTVTNANGALWGNPSGHTSTGGTGNSADPANARYDGTIVWPDGKKSIYDPCPLGYRVPSLNGFYFGQSGKMADVVHFKSTSVVNPYSYCDLDGVGAESTGYMIYYFGQYKNYEKYYTWMPMTPYYAGSATQLTSPKAGSEGFAYTWLNSPSGGSSDASGDVIAWHPCNYHIHTYGNYGAASYNGGTVRCVRETDPDIVTATVPDQIVLLADAGDMMSFDILTHRGWKVEYNNLSYSWLKAEKMDDNTVNVTSMAPNLTGKPREGLIYIVLDSGEKYPVRIIQESVSISGTTLTVGCTVNATATTTFDIPAGGTLTLPGGGTGTSYTSLDGRFQYTLSATTGSGVTLTVNALLANASPDDIPAELHMNLSDGVNNNDLKVNVVQQKYTITTTPITVEYTAGSMDQNTKFTPPSTPTLPITDDGWFTYTLTAGGGGQYTLKVTAINTNYGPQHTEKPKIMIGGYEYTVTVTQKTKADGVTYNLANKTVPAITGSSINDLLKIGKAKDYNLVVDEVPEWASISVTSFTPFADDKDTQIPITATKTFLTTDGSTRTGTVELKLYYGGQDVRTLEFDIAQASQKMDFTAGTLSGTKGSSWTTNMKLKTGDKDHNYYYELVSCPDWANLGTPGTKQGPIQSKDAQNIFASATATKTSLEARDGIVELMVYYGDETEGSLLEVPIHQAASSISLSGGTLGSDKNASGTAITFSNANGLTYEVLSQPTWLNLSSTSGTVSGATYNLSGTTNEFNIGSTRTGTVTVKVMDGTEVLGTKDVVVTQTGAGITVTGTLDMDKKAEDKDKALTIKNASGYHYQIISTPDWLSITSGVLEGDITIPNLQMKITKTANTTGQVRSGDVVVQLSKGGEIAGTLTATFSQKAK